MGFSFELAAAAFHFLRVCKEAIYDQTDIKNILQLYDQIHVSWFQQG